MKQKTTKSLYTVLGTILCISTINALHVTCQGIGALICPESFGIQWSDTEKWMQVTILMACSAALFVYVFCYDNMQLVGLPDDAARQIELNLNTIVSAQIFVVFALMYKVAVKVSEENSLTI